MISGTGFLAVAAREAAATASAEARNAAEKVASIAAEKAAEKAKQEILQSKVLTVMRLWYKDSPSEFIIDVVDLPSNKIKELISAFEKVKTYYHSTTGVKMSELKKISGLTEVELKPLLALLLQQRG